MINLNIKNQDAINASKALVTVCLTLLATYSFLPPMAIYFSLYTAACCAFMQSGETKLEQLGSMLLAGAAFVFFLAFGLFIKNHPFFANTALVVFAFGAFYLPNLGFVYKLPPVLGIIFYEFIISMPTESCPFWLTILGSVIATIIAILVYFLFWPYEVKHELTLIAQSLTHQYRTILERCFLMMRSHRKDARKDQLKQIEESLDRISKLLAVYEKLNEAATFKKGEDSYFDILYLKLYSLLQINTMMTERFPTLPMEKRTLCQQLLRDLILQFKEIEYRFDHMVPHSLIAKNLIGKSLHLGKSLTFPLLRVRQKPKRALLTEPEFNALLEQLIADEKDIIRQFAFALLRLRELLQQLHLHQEEMHFNLKRGVFL